MNEAEAVEVSTDVKSDTPRQHRLLGSIAAVLAGFLAMVILSTATDKALQATGVYPALAERMAVSLFVFAVTRIVYVVVGCYLAALLAPARPMLHALILGLVFCIAGAALMWVVGGPVWYALAIIAIALPCAWIGGKLRLIQRRADG